ARRLALPLDPLSSLSGARESCAAQARPAQANPAQATAVLQLRSDRRLAACTSPTPCLRALDPPSIVTVPSFSSLRANQPCPFCRRAAPPGHAKRDMKQCQIETDAAQAVASARLRGGGDAGTRPAA